MNKNPNQSGLKQNKLKRTEKKRLERLKIEQDKKDKERLEFEEFRINPEESVDRYIHDLVKNKNNANERISKVLLKWWEIKKKTPLIEEDDELDMEMLKSFGKSATQSNPPKEKKTVH